MRFYMTPVVLANHPRVGMCLLPVTWNTITGWRGWDARTDRTVTNAVRGYFIQTKGETLAQHTAAIAIANVLYIPFEDVGGNVLPLSARVLDVSAANRTLISNRLESWDIPTQGFTGQTLLSEVVKTVIRRLRIRDILQLDDFSEGLDTLVSAVDVAKRQRIGDKLRAVGFDTSDIVPTDTIREALRKLAAQDINILRDIYNVKEA